MVATAARQRSSPASLFAALRVLAVGRGGRVVSEEYHGLKSRIEFECAAGHRFVGYPKKVFSGTWCQRCKASARYSELRELVAARGGEVLSPEYVPHPGSMRYRCAAGHEWERPAHMIRAGVWCPRCRGRGTTLAELQALAAGRGGRCLARRYRAYDETVSWECARKHRFRMRIDGVKDGGWCPSCRTLDGAVAKALAIAAERGGQLLSTRGIGPNARLLWRCAKGHEWVSKPTSVATGRRWCHQCRLLGIEAMQALAAERGGKCVSTEYKHTHSPLQ